MAYVDSFFATVLRSLLDDAILEHKEIATGWIKVDEVPFDVERRLVSVRPDHADQRILVVKGSPEDILRVCSGYALGEALKALAASCVAVMVFNAKRSAAILEQPGP